MKKDIKKEVKIEESAMLIGFFINLIMGIAGMYMYFTTKLNALYLDGAFSVISAFSCIFAIFISRFSNKTTKKFPDGLNFLEPLYGLLKSGLSIYLLISALVSAIKKLYDYFTFEKGDLIVADNIIAYSISMIILCFLLSLTFKIFNKKILYSSIMLKAETKASFIDGIISLGVGGAIILVLSIPKNGNLMFIHYTADSFITLILIALTCREPIKIFIDSFLELTRGINQSKDIKHEIDNTIELQDLKDKNIKIKNINIFKVGKKIIVEMYIDLEDSENTTVKNIEDFKDKVYERLNNKFTLLEIRSIIK